MRLDELAAGRAVAVKRSHNLREAQLLQAPEEAVRRLARYCGVEKWDTQPVRLLIDELGWKGYVDFPWPKGCY